MIANSKAFRGVKLPVRRGREWGIGTLECVETDGQHTRLVLRLDSFDIETFRNRVGEDFWLDLVTE